MTVKVGEFKEKTYDKNVQTARSSDGKIVGVMTMTGQSKVTFQGVSAGTADVTITFADGSTTIEHVTVTE